MGITIVAMHIFFIQKVNIDRSYSDQIAGQINSRCMESSTPGTTEYTKKWGLLPFTIVASQISVIKYYMYSWPDHTT